MRERRWRFVGCGADDCWDFLLEVVRETQRNIWIWSLLKTVRDFCRGASKSSARNSQRQLENKTLLWIRYLCLKHTCCKMFWKIFNSVLFSTMFSQASAVTLLRSQLRDPNALCNDGSQAVYYHQQVKAKSSTTKK